MTELTALPETLGYGFEPCLDLGHLVNALARIVCVPITTGSHLWGGERSEDRIGYVRRGEERRGEESEKSMVKAHRIAVRIHVFVLRAEMAPLPAVDGAEIALLAIGEPDRVEVLA